MAAVSKKLSSQFENNRLSILKIASKLFCDKGIIVTSFTDISKAVKLSKGTIYYYYPSKDHLIYDVADYHLNQVTDSIFSWLETVGDQSSLKQTLMLLFQSVFSGEEQCRLHFCLISYSVMGNDVIKNMIRERISKWHTMIEIGLARTDHPRQITDALFMCLESIILKRALGVMDIPEEDICSHIAALV